MNEKSVVRMPKWDVPSKPDALLHVLREFFRFAALAASCESDYHCSMNVADRTGAQIYYNIVNRTITSGVGHKDHEDC
jgi:hypothetical protein